MDQAKIGRFIALERKKRNYTQRELAEKLGISDKTISKWECGNGFPEVSLLLPLCDELNFTVNELLSGERIQEADYKKKAEENMMEIMKHNKKSKEEIRITYILIISIVIITIAGSVLGKFFQNPQALTAIVIMYFVALACVIATWIAVSISLRKNK